MHKVILLTLAFSICLFFSSCMHYGPDYGGSWIQEVTYADAPEGLPSYFLFEFVFTHSGEYDHLAPEKEGSYENYMYVKNDQNVNTLYFGHRGTYLETGQIFYITITEQYNVTNEETLEGAWAVLDTPLEGTALYSTSWYNPLVLTIDHNQDGEYDTSHPIEDVYPGGDGPQFDITYILLENKNN